MTASTWHVRLETEPGFWYQSGQFILVHYEGAGRLYRIPYSIASPAESGGLELCMSCPAEGPLAGFPCGLEKGAGLVCEGPFGLMAPRHPEKDALFVAHGTGIGPIRSILRDLVRRQTGSLTLLFGARNEAQILYREEWEDLASRDGRFRFLPVLSQASAEWKGLRGRVQQHLAPFFTQPELAVYICGAPGMVQDVHACFSAAGFDGRQLIYERYGED